MVRNSRAMASTQAGPVAVSIVLASLHPLRDLMQDWAKYRVKALKPLLEDAFSKLGHLLVDDTAWTDRIRYSSRKIFKDSVTFKTWQSATNLYLMTKASDECD